MFDRWRASAPVHAPTDSVRNRRVAARMDAQAGCRKGDAMIDVLNRVVEYVEDNLDGEIDIPALASSVGTTEYHLRRMFSSLAGIPLSEYVRPAPDVCCRSRTPRRRRSAGHRGALRLRLDRGIRSSFSSGAWRESR